MPRTEASTRGIQQSCVDAVQRSARCKEDAIEVLDQCVGMKTYLTPRIVELVTARFYLQREVDRATTEYQDYHESTKTGGRPTAAVASGRTKRERALSAAQAKLEQAVTGLAVEARRERDPTKMT